MWHWAFLIPLAAIVIPVVSIVGYYRLQTRRTEIISAAFERGADIPDELLPWMEKKKSDEERKHEKDMALIENGLYESYQQRRSLKVGIILGSLGTAFTIFSIVVSIRAPFRGGGGDWLAEAGDWTKFLLAGLILLFLGAGLIIFHYLTRREEKTTVS
jgi:hypothetical protein